MIAWGEVGRNGSMMPATSYLVLILEHELERAPQDRRAEQVDCDIAFLY